MKAQRKALLADLLQTLSPHLAGVLQEDQPAGKAITKTLQQLAEQLLRARAKQQKRALLTPPPAMQQRLTDTLTAALDTELAGTDYTSKKVKHVIAESAEHLAIKLAKLRHKREKKVTQLPSATEADQPAAASPSQAAGTSNKRPSRRSPSRPPHASEES